MCKVDLHVGAGRCVASKGGFKEDLQQQKQATECPKGQAEPKGLGPMSLFVEPSCFPAGHFCNGQGSWQLSPFTSEMCFSLSMPATFLPPTWWSVCSRGHGLFPMWTLSATWLPGGCARSSHPGSVPCE